MLCESLCHTIASMPRFYFVSLLLLFVLHFFFCFHSQILILRGRLQGQRAEVRGLGNEWDQDACCEIHKESMKTLK